MPSKSRPRSDTSSYFSYSSSNYSYSPSEPSSSYPYPHSSHYRVSKPSRNQVSINGDNQRKSRKSEGKEKACEPEASIQPCCCTMLYQPQPYNPYPPFNPYQYHNWNHSVTPRVICLPQDGNWDPCNDNGCGLVKILNCGCDDDNLKDEEACGNSTGKNRDGLDKKKKRKNSKKKSSQRRSTYPPSSSDAEPSSYYYSVSTQTDSGGYSSSKEESSPTYYPTAYYSGTASRPRKRESF